MTSRGRTLGATAALWVAAAGTGALEAQPTQPFVESVDVQVVEVDVVVTDKKGRPVKGLTGEDFELYVDGQPVDVTNFYEAAIYLEERTDRRNRERPVIRSESTPGRTREGPLTVVFYLDDANVYPAHRTRLLRRLEAAIEPWRSMDAGFMLARFVNRIEVLVPPTRDPDAILDGAASVPKGSPRALQTGEAARRFAIRSLIDAYEACEAAPFCRPCEDQLGRVAVAGAAVRGQPGDKHGDRRRRPGRSRDDARRRAGQEGGRVHHGRSAPTTGHLRTRLSRQ